MSLVYLSASIYMHRELETSILARVLSVYQSIVMIDDRANDHDHPLTWHVPGRAWFRYIVNLKTLNTTVPVCNIPRLKLKDDPKRRRGRYARYTAIVYEHVAENSDWFILTGITSRDILVIEYGFRKMEFHQDGTPIKSGSSKDRFSYILSIWSWQSVWHVGDLTESTYEDEEQTLNGDYEGRKCLYRTIIWNTCFSLQWRV